MSLQSGGSTRWFAVSGMAAPLAFTGIIAAATVLTPDYSSIRSSISQLASPDMPYGSLASAAFVVFGVLMMPMPLGVYRALDGRLMAPLTGAMLLVGQISSMMAGVFPNNSEQLVWLLTTENALHESAVRSAAGSVVMVILLVAYSVRAQDNCRHLLRFSIFIALFIGVAYSLFELDTWARMTGLFERIFVGFGLLWIVVFSAKLFWDAGRDTQQSFRDRPHPMVPAGGGQEGE